MTRATDEHRKARLIEQKSASDHRTTEDAIPTVRIHRKLSWVQVVELNGPECYDNDILTR